MEDRIGILTALLFYTKIGCSSHYTQETPMEFGFARFVDPVYGLSVLHNDSSSTISHGYVHTCLVQQ